VGEIAIVTEATSPRPLFGRPWLLFLLFMFSEENQGFLLADPFKAYLEQCFDFFCILRSFLVFSLKMTNSSEYLILILTFFVEPL